MLVHGELAALLLDQIATLDAKIAQLGTRAAELTAAMPAAWGIDADGTTGPGAGTGPGAPVVTLLWSTSLYGVAALWVLFARKLWRLRS